MAISIAMTVTVTIISISVKPAKRLHRVALAVIATPSAIDVPVHTALRLAARSPGRRRRLHGLERRFAIAADAERHRAAVVERHHSSDRRRRQTDSRERRTGTA